ncbi:hypothetical protein QOZ80_1AG0010450 [Eleusine coracana subsp. coracana]|nr:hypothetical protein QOZ80_1AG0010450 [Eleusine coracana subsp. coracana]
MEADMDIELEPSRKGLFQGRVLMADALCRSAHGTLDALSADLLESGGDRKTPPCGEEAAQRKLEDAGVELGLALANMGTARHITRRVGAAPESADDDLAGDPDVRCAMEWMEKAEALAVGAHDRVEASRGHLGAAALLRVLKDESGGGGGEDAALWEQSPCFSERLNGVMEVSRALSKAVDLVDATVAASKAAFSSSGGTD